MNTRPIAGAETARFAVGGWGGGIDDRRFGQEGSGLRVPVVQQRKNGPGVEAMTDGKDTCRRVLGRYTYLRIASRSTWCAYMRAQKGYPMNKEELIGRILAATPEQLKTMERALSGEKAAEVTDTRLLTFTQAALWLQVSRMTIWRMVKEGRLPTVETRLDRYRVPAAALTAFVTRAA
ncbi:MAG: helix-turn-helix domain-containing protein [Lentisphaerota bacterium]